MLNANTESAVSMQVAELLKEVRVDYEKTSGVEGDLVSLKNFLEQLPTDEVWFHAGVKDALRF